jgi:(1->4)-alpha-D-glucan 1-alpha-D-glucosylmutase
VIKAVREAKVYTAWIKPDEIYENAVTDFTMKITDTATGKDFLHDFLPFVKKVSFYGVLNSLSQVCIKIAAPGVPDFYRGTELWEFAFVDPDNRRALDYGVSQNNAAIIKERENDPSFAAELLAGYKSGLVKQFLIYKLLNVRRKEEQLFTNGGFVSLKTAGRHADKVITFARDKDTKLAVIAAPRITSMMVREDEMPAGEHVWGDTHIILPEDSPQVFTCAVTGKTVKADGRKLYLRDVLAVFPCGIVISE